MTFVHESFQAVEFLDDPIVGCSNKGWILKSHVEDPGAMLDLYSDSATVVFHRSVWNEAEATALLAEALKARQKSYFESQRRKLTRST